MPAHQHSPRHLDKVSLLAVNVCRRMAGWAAVPAVDTYTVQKSPPRNNATHYYDTISIPAQVSVVKECEEGFCHRPPRNGLKTTYNFSMCFEPKRSCRFGANTCSHAHTYVLL